MPTLNRKPPHHGVPIFAILAMLVLTCLASNLASAATPMTFAFTLDGACATSAGAFKTDGTLVKTLWRKVPYTAGTHTATWDGTSDDGAPAPIGAYEIRVLVHNLNYVWEGVIGNTSKSFTGRDIWKTFYFIPSLSAAGDTVYAATAYNEAQHCLVKFSNAKPQARTSLFHADPFTSFAYVTTDGVRSYWATNGGGVGRKYCFVIALNAGTETTYPFPKGKDLALNRNYGDQKYSGAIDYSDSALTHVATGLAVQRNGNVLAVAHGNTDKVLLYDKVSGALIKTIDNVPLNDRTSNPDDSAEETQLAMTASNDMWVLCGTTARRYTNLLGTPAVAATITGLTAGKAIAVHPTDNNLILISDGGSSQQVKAFNSQGAPLWTMGQAGGYASDPTVANDKFGLNAALCVLPDGSFWLGDATNTRLMHFSDSRVLIESIQYLVHNYVSTVDLNNPARVFAEYKEYRVDYSRPLVPGANGPWRLEKNWAAGQTGTDKFMAGLRCVATLSNGRTYALLSGTDVVELPASGALRKTGVSVKGAIYADGSVRYSTRSGGTQTVYQRALSGFDGKGNPQWGDETVLATMPDGAGDPTYRGAFTGPLPARFPVTASDVVISFDPGVQGNEGFHLGGARKGENRWLWKASPTGWTNGKGNFQTKAIDGAVNYGGNTVCASGQNVVYGYHGEFWRPSPKDGPGQANKFMHFWDDGLFVGEFGVGKQEAAWQNNPAGMGGNSFSPVLTKANGKTYLYVNDESTHGGVHRWLLENAERIHELAGRGTLGQSEAVVCTRP